MKEPSIEDIIQWDVYNWKYALRFWEKHLPKNGKALAIGEREGGLTVWLNHNGFNVICSDYTDNKETAKPLHTKYGIEDKVEYQVQDMTQLTLPDNSVDIVIFKSVVGALGDYELQKKAFSEMHRVLKKGGKLLFAENLNASRAHRFARRKFTNWGERWRYPSLADFRTFTNNFSQFEYETRGFSATFGRSEKQRKTLGRLDQTIRPLTPKSWRYILSGVAIK